MTIFAMDCAPENVRGELTRWMLEIKPGVFVGNINVKIRNLLWERICTKKIKNGAIMIYSANNEQGFEMRLYGMPKRSIVDFEGVQLIMFNSE